MRHVLVSTGILLLAASPVRASECEDLPTKGQASIEEKYLKIKAESEHADTDCDVSRSNDVMGTGHPITVRCRIHFRPRNGACFVSYTPSGIDPNLSNHPGCRSVWVWIQGTEMETNDTAQTPTGQTFIGRLRFDMMKAKYEIKYKVLVGEKKGSKPVNETYQATLKQICMRKYD